MTLLLTYPGYRPEWQRWEMLRAGWPAERRLAAGLKSLMMTAYEQIAHELITK
jgi:hypothetical protein